MISWSSIISNKFNKNTMFMLGEKGFTLPLNLLTFLIMARMFGPVDFGLMSFGLSLVAIFAPFSKLAYETIITKYLSLGYQQKSVLRGSVRLRLLGSFVVFSLLAFTVFLFLEDQVLISFILAMGATLWVEALMVQDSLFQSVLKSKYNTYARSTGIVVGSLMRIGVAYYLQDIFLIGLSFILERLITLLLMQYFASKLNQERTADLGATVTSQKIFLESLPLIMTNIFVLVSFKVDQIFIEYMIGPAEVGIYASAARFSEVWYILPVIVMSTYFPFIAKNISERVKVEGVLLKISRSLMFLSIGLTFIVSIGAHFLIENTLGPAFIEAADVLKIHIITSIFFFAGHPISKVLIARNKTWINFSGKLVAALLNIALNLILIPNWGIQGAAFATLISYAFGYYLFYFFYQETRSLAWKITKEPLRSIYSWFGKLLNVSK